jgi:hypothetical protein
VVIADIGMTSGDYVSFISSENEKGAYETGKKPMRSASTAMMMEDNPESTRKTIDDKKAPTI